MGCFVPAYREGGGGKAPRQCPPLSAVACCPLLLLTRALLVTAIAFEGGAFALTTFRSEGMVAALLYFVLKYNVSGGITSQVCFEDV